MSYSKAKAKKLNANEQSSRSRKPTDSSTNKTSGNNARNQFSSILHSLHKTRKDSTSSTVITRNNEDNNSMTTSLTNKSNGTNSKQVNAPKSSRTPPNSPIVKTKISNENQLQNSVNQNSDNQVKYLVINENQSQYSMEIKKQKNPLTIQSLYKEMKSLREEYKKDFEQFKNESNNTTLNLKVELKNEIREKFEKLQTTIEQEDINIRMLSQQLSNILEHYQNFVVFIMDHTVFLTKKVEYLSQLSYSHGNERNKILCNNCLHSINNQSNYKSDSTTLSIPYSISISSSNTDKLNCQLEFDPVPTIKLPEFIHNVDEYIESLPILNNKAKVKSHSKSYETLPKALTDLSRKVDNLKQFTNDFKLNQLDLNHDYLQFKDLKQRYLKLKNLGLRCNTFPALNTHIFEIADPKPNVMHENYENNEIPIVLVQSETEIYKGKFDIEPEEETVKDDESDDLPTINIHQKIIYQNILLNDLEKLHYQISQSNLNESGQFSLILPRSKLSEILANNFTNISDALMDASIIAEEQDHDSEEFEKLNHSDHSEEIWLFDDAEFIDDDYQNLHLFGNLMEHHESNTFNTTDSINSIIDYIHNL